MLDGSLAAGFAAIFGPFYRPAFLRRATYADDGKGGRSECRTEVPCRVQVDTATQRPREPGNPQTDATIIILASGVLDVRDDDELEVDQVTYMLSSPTLDALKSHWRCAARRKP